MPRRYVTMRDTSINKFLNDLSPKERNCIRTALETGNDINFGDPCDWPMFIPYTRRSEVEGVYWRLRSKTWGFWKYQALPKLRFLRHQDRGDKPLT